jgi:transposase
MKCGGVDFVKNGSVKGLKKLKCKECGFQSVVLARPPAERFLHEKHFKEHPQVLRTLGILLYSLGLSMTAIGKLLHISPNTVMRWIKVYVKRNCPKPEPKVGEAAVMEIDEMWHFLKKSPANSGFGKLFLGIRNASSTGSWGVVTDIPLTACTSD